MRILVVGSGGREHALCWRISQSPQCDKLYCAPGNPGTAESAENISIPVGDIDALIEFAKANAVDLTVVGPEEPLCNGIQDRFTKAGLLLFGPSALAARLEGSKVFAKEFMRENNIPTAKFGVFEDVKSATSYIDANPDALIVKADGLAAGKGVFVCKDSKEAKIAVDLLLKGSLGAAGNRVIVEQRLVGEEVSVIGVSDGSKFMLWASSQDHKSVFDGDHGPNTGGMGAYSPAPFLTSKITKCVLDQILKPTIDTMASAGTPYRGILYAGLMIVDEKPFVLEFNCRMGDPETQPLMARFSSDLVLYLYGAASGKLPNDMPQWDDRCALCVVLAAKGYPGSYKKGFEIFGLDQFANMSDLVVFHAGTSKQNGKIVTNGGRVLGVTALGNNIIVAQKRAYEAVKKIQWEGMHYRRDIGHHAVSLGFGNIKSIEIENL